MYRPAIKTGTGAAGIDKSWAQLIGTAIDFRLRLAFTTANLVPLTAQGGYGALARRHLDAAHLLTGLTEATKAVLAAAGLIGSTGIELPGRSEDDLIRLCVVAGQLDQLYRKYESVVRTTPLLDGDTVATLEQAIAQVPSRVVDDLHDQVTRANDGLGPLRASATKVTAGLEFAGSHLIGADADLLVDGLLLDIKAKNEATTIKKPEVYQLAGYVLLDFDDIHRIEQVGIYWTRHGVMRTFSVPVFFELLGATAPIDELRGRLRDELSSYARQAGHAPHAELRQPAEPDQQQDEPDQPVVIEQLPAPEDTRLGRSVRWLRGVLRR
ncbi:hypothetical protein LRS71_23450 [Rhodococcus pyridinivorans]|uniref:hypothetical protein n=1 Tax=Rhodococcus pyridinivorans TaxID=103816 RepID=UPI001E45A200|nr:hypothetical protein [Rhodococcus pyridinivorans]MCD5422473.1 hypothetical protein [Rhodococcus pyridinivorans]